MRVLRSYWSLILAAAAITIIALLSPRVIPLYDGVGFPDEAYRYVSPPTPSQKTDQPPSTATTTAVATSGKNAISFDAVSDEQGPQVRIYLPKNSVSAATTTTSFKLTAAPIAPSNTPAGPIVGNIYRFSITGDGGNVSFDKNTYTAGTIDLRLPQGYSPGASFEYRPNQTANWQELKTFKVGNDIYEAIVVGFGDYGLIHSANIQTYKPKKDYTIFFITGAVIALIVLTLGLVRLEPHIGNKKNSK